MATIKMRQNGPYLVEGDDVTVVDWNGAPYEIPKRPFALCRCGASDEQTVLRRDPLQNWISGGRGRRQGLRGQSRAVINCRLQIADFRLQISICALQSSICNWSLTCSGQSRSDQRRLVGCEQQAAPLGLAEIIRIPIGAHESA